MAGTSPAMTKKNKELSMPEVTVNMAAGRTEEQKLGMMRDITQALVKNLGADANDVVIQINEAPLHHKMKGGKSFVERAAAKK
jgi:4-oxalocrotonate tautomerase